MDELLDELVQDEHAELDVDGPLRKLSSHGDAEQNLDGLTSKSSDSEPPYQSGEDPLNKLSDGEHLDQSFDKRVSMSNNSGFPDQSVEGSLSKLSDHEQLECSVDDILMESIDDGHREQNLDDFSSESDGTEHVKKTLDDSHTDEIRTTIHPHWQEEVYQNMEETLKDIALRLNNIPVGLLRSEHLSRWTFENPSRDKPTARPELFLEQHDFTEDERANRIMDWLDQRFPRIRMKNPIVSEDNTEISCRAEENDIDFSQCTNPRWFYTEVDFNQWLVKENRSSQEGHARGSFVKKGGDWRCQTCKYQGLQVWFDRMIAYCPLCKQSNGPSTQGEVTWYDVD